VRLQSFYQVLKRTGGVADGKKSRNTFIIRSGSPPYEPLPPSFSLLFCRLSWWKPQFFWPFLVPMTRNPHKMRSIYCFSTATGIKIEIVFRILFLHQEEDSWQQA
jgi:hypothetical protein